MSQPTPFTRSFSFTDFEANQPTAPKPGVNLDAEFSAIEVTARTILANLAKIQRDDGALKNLIVTLDSLSPAVLLAFGAGGSWVPRGAWATATEYGVGDVVTVGTQSWVNSIAHTSLADFAADNATGRWTLLFDSAGSTPADDSVTSAKLAPGAVDTDAIGFTALDLAGTVRGQGGVSAGTAPLGSLLHAKKATGEVYGKVERTTDAQGAVGYQIIGVSATWTLAMVQGLNSLYLYNGAALAATFPDVGGLDIPGTIRATTGAVPVAGSGVGLTYIASIGYLNSYDYGLGVWRDLKLRGKDAYLTAGGVDVVKVTSTGAEVTGSFKVNGAVLGYLGAPQNIKPTAYTLALADQGKHVYSENVAGQVITVPLNSAVAFPVETVILIVNDGTNPITLTPEGAVQLRLAGFASVGARTIAAGGVASLLKVKADRWFVSGVGVS